MTGEPSHGRAYVVDDEPGSLAFARGALSRVGFEVDTFADVTEIRAALRDRPAPDLVVTDLHMPDGTGVDVLEAVQALGGDTMVVVMTGLATVKSAVDAMRRGAWDYLVKPFESPDELVSAALRAREHQRVLRRNQWLEQRVELTERFAGIVGQGARMRAVFDLVDRIAKVDTTVLVHGESGTGKELVVRAIHDRSARAGRPFVAVNCGAFAEQLLESELFGHQRGAFTGANTARRGLFEEAHGGTIFLDEIGELPLALQVKLLRVVQEQEVRPVGANTARKISVRVVSATHRDLESLVARGTFREDLYFRLNVVRIDLPPLRERLDDLPLLVKHFLDKHAARHGRPSPAPTAELLECLARHAWPGNVRELENTLERVLVLGGVGPLVDLLPATLRAPSKAPIATDEFGLPLARARDAFERNYLADVLSRANGSIAAAARMAEVDRTNLRRLLRRHGLVAGGSGDPPGSD